MDGDNHVISSGATHATTLAFFDGSQVRIMNSASRIMNFVFKIMNCVFKMVKPGIILRRSAHANDPCGSVRESGTFLYSK